MNDLRLLMQIVSTKAQQETQAERRHYHCVHAYEGVLHMVVQLGHVVVQCCECGEMFAQQAGHHWQGVAKPCDRHLVFERMDAAPKPDYEKWARKFESLVPRAEP